MPGQTQWKTPPTAEEKIADNTTAMVENIARHAKSSEEIAKAIRELNETLKDSFGTLASVMESLGKVNEKRNDGIAELSKYLDAIQDMLVYMNPWLSVDRSPIKIKLLRNGAKVPVRAKGSAGYDLFVPEETVIQAGQTVLIHLGFACKLPHGCHALINTRSSTWRNYGIELTNQTGIIDNTYCGDGDEWILSVRRPPEYVSPAVITAGAKIAQFRLAMDSPDYKWEVVDTLNSPNRGGFGSTGI